MQTLKELFLFSGYMLLKAMGLILLGLTMRYIIWGFVILLITAFTISFVGEKIKVLLGCFQAIKIPENVINMGIDLRKRKKRIKFEINKEKIPKLTTISCKETFLQ